MENKTQGILVSISREEFLTEAISTCFDDNALKELFGAMKFLAITCQQDDRALELSLNNCYFPFSNKECFIVQFDGTGKLKSKLFELLGSTASYKMVKENEVIHEAIKNFELGDKNIYWFDNIFYFLIALIENNLKPKGLEEDQDELFDNLVSMYRQNPKILVLDEKNTTLYIDSELFSKTYQEKNQKGYHGQFAEILKSQVIKSKSLNKTEAETLKTKIRDELLNCEKFCADIDPYDTKLLTDPNRGHWDLYNNKCDGYFREFDIPFYPRDPKDDIKDDGIIAIDFGTKSTVVVYQKNNQNTLPMAIGHGDRKKINDKKRYENPTIMQFVRLEKFLSEYNEKLGRPNTHWDDLPISHTAMERLSQSSSEEYSSILSQIKQWAGLTKKKLRIRTKAGETIELVDFLSLKDKDVNPIEIYAYYIGRYINNMINGVYLRYMLSFPVTYKKEIRDKITESFEKGIKKSLPISVLQNKALMEKFKIDNQYSEPQAYAACALTEYEFFPDDKEEIFYGVFDFGGGTTDFDFGVWKNYTGKSSQFDFELESYPNPNGDPYLGGENLLERLAYWIFYENREIMVDGDYQFSLPPGENEFAGSDALISDSLEADKNIRNLMEKLRPFWENSEKFIFPIEKTDNNADDADIEDPNAKEEILKCTLYNKDGEQKVDVQLKFTRRYIFDFFEKKIQDGIDKFFNSLTETLGTENIGNSNKINIFLAGNSCKSPIVKKLFQKRIAKEIEKAKIKNKDIDDDIFELFYPLGSNEAIEKMKERGIDITQHNEESPTGKTGVAYGLLRFHDWKIKVDKQKNQKQIEFRFYLGKNKKQKFNLFSSDDKQHIKGKPDYGVWYEYEKEIESGDIYIYYTDNPSCIDDSLPMRSSDIKRKIISVPSKITKSTSLFIRASDPETLEYAFTTSEKTLTEKKSSIKIQKINLGSE